MSTFLQAAGRRGITPDAARTLVRTNATVIAALMLRRGEADAMLCGLEGRFRSNLRHISDIVGLAPGIHELAAMSLLVTSKGAYFLADTHVRPDPSAAEIAEMTVSCASHVRRFGMDPKVALLSHSDFGSSDSDSARKMRAALSRWCASSPRPSRSTARWRPTARSPSSSGTGSTRCLTSRERPTCLVLPNLDAANIAFQLVKIMADALPVGPILVGPAKPVHILTPSVTARGIVNMTAVAVVEAQSASATAAPTALI